MWKLALTLSLPVALSGCSLILDTSINGLKCSLQQCEEGYSCRFEDCVAKASLKEGETCTKVEQCESGLLCPPLLFVCAKPCARIYDIASECGPDAVCAPVYDEVNKGKFLTGACVPNECEAGQQSDAATGSNPADAICQTDGGKLVRPNANNRCVKLSQNGGLCLNACAVGTRKVDDMARGTDVCTTDVRGNPQHCGRVASGDFVCVASGKAIEGSRCTLFPLSVAGGDDACDLNNSSTPPGLPLVCANADGLINGELKCRRAACDLNNPTASGCEAGQICENKNGMTLCRAL